MHRSIIARYFWKLQDMQLEQEYVRDGKHRLVYR